MKLYSAWFCPFAQRAWMAFLAKGVAFEYLETDPYDKTPEWLAISLNTGQVPVVVSSGANGRDGTIVDSTAIVAHVDQLRPDSLALFSADPDRRQQQEDWISHIGQAIVPYFYRFLKASVAGDAQDQARDKMVAGLMAFAQEMLDGQDPDGPYFSGDQLSAVDISLIPFAYRIELLLKHYRTFTLPEKGDIWQRYHQWYRAVVDHPAFVATGVDVENYDRDLIKFYLPYSQGGGQEDVTEV